jgi:hypothetical protein
VRAETCSDVTCVIYTRKEVVAKETIITVFICQHIYFNCYISLLSGFNGNIGLTKKQKLMSP